MLCNRCEGLTSVKQCCGQHLCHLCVKKHVCNVSSSTTEQSSSVHNHTEELLQSYRAKIESLTQLFTITREESDKLKQQNKELYEENQNLIMTVGDLREEIALSRTSTNTNNSTNSTAEPYLVESALELSPRQPLTQQKDKHMIGKERNKSTTNSSSHTADNSAKKKHILPTSTVVKKK